MRDPHHSLTLPACNIRIGIIFLGLKVAIVQVDAWIPSNALVLLGMEVKFHSTQEALLLEHNLLFMSVVHLANVPLLAKIELANMDLDTIWKFSRLNREDGV